MNIISDEVWRKIDAPLRKQCPRLTREDLAEAQSRIDLLIAKIQNRHWIDRITARRTVLALLQQCGGVPAGA